MGVLLTIGAVLRVVARRWKLAVVVVVALGAVYVLVDRANAKRRAQAAQQSAAQWRDYADTQAAKLDALVDAQARMALLMADRNDAQREIARQSGALQAAITRANANAASAYGACASVPLPGAVQTQLDQMLGYDSKAGRHADE